MISGKDDLPELPSLNRIQPEHIAYVRSVVRRFKVKPVHWRADLVQDVLIEAYKSRESRLDVRALLFGITRHVVIRWMTKRCAEREVATFSEEEAISNPCDEDDLRKAERATLVWRAINQLPDIFREVFVRAEIDQWTMPEIVTDLGIPINTGYTRLYLARGRFLQALQRLLARSHIQGEP